MTDTAPGPPLWSPSPPTLRLTQPPVHAHGYEIGVALLNHARQDFGNEIADAMEELLDELHKVRWHKITQGLQGVGGYLYVVQENWAELELHTLQPLIKAQVDRYTKSHEEERIERPEPTRLAARPRRRIRR